MKDHFFISRSFIYSLCLATAALAGCSSPHSLNNSYHSSRDKNNAPDFSEMYNWAAHPYKVDPSDSTPAPYRQFIYDSTVDVFFIYPTSYTDNDAVNPEDLSNPLEQLKWNASVNDSALNERTDESSILYQASVFNHYRVFAPRYRQAHYQSFFIPDSLSKPFFDTAFSDVQNAFNYYLKYYNQGRPFIIASHSQGTVHAIRLIRESIENAPCKQQLLAAYLPGVPVQASYFKQFKPCNSSNETGCFVSWRTFKKGYEPEWVKNEHEKMVVVNPLTWESNTNLAQKEYNGGAVLYKFNKPKEHAVSAQVHGNILWTSKPRFWGSIFLTRKNYHIGDYNLFWKNIRDNVDERVAAYKQEQGLASGSK
jgi:hypothetical protein